ncbi:MAG TPA: IS1595 family transposase [Ignavibacteria bacterium]|nr:IS1595 family transposase [Ignavibacteria bacterium]
MTTKEKILALYTGLSQRDRELVICELEQIKRVESQLSETTSPLYCPHCESKLIVKNGKRNSLQQYKCKTCCRVFTSRTGTPLHKIQKPDKFEAYKRLMLEHYLPLNTIAKKIGISIQTAFDWRHKILSSVNNDEVKFEGITEIDDIWFLYSQKGRKGLKYSRKRGGSKRAGDNDFQAKLLVTSDRKSNTNLSLVRIGRLKRTDIERKISGKFSENVTLVSDKHRSISSFAKSEGLNHVSFKSSEHTAGGQYHVQGVNNLASRLKGTINYSCRGVSTKYLQSYANWVNLIAKGVDNIEFNNKGVVDIHKNREGIYKRFIENFSRRTYRCPVKRFFKSQLNDDMIANLKYI